MRLYRPLALACITCSGVVVTLHCYTAVTSHHTAVPQGLSQVDCIKGLVCRGVKPTAKIEAEYVVTAVISNLLISVVVCKGAVLDSSICDWGWQLVVVVQKVQCTSVT
eukprot:19985-Heterococcus_DN1.PRE.2